MILDRVWLLTSAHAPFTAAVAGLTLPLAKELAEFGIRSISIAPGPFGEWSEKGGGNSESSD